VLTEPERGSKVWDPMASLGELEGPKKKKKKKKKKTSSQTPHQFVRVGDLKK